MQLIQNETFVRVKKKSQEFDFRKLCIYFKIIDNETFIS